MTEEELAQIEARAGTMLPGVASYIEALIAALREAWKERDALRAEVETLRAAMIDLLENVEEPPDRNCSCHLSPPCNDCIDYGGLRGALKEARAALQSREEETK